MLIAIIASLIGLAITTILFTPELRTFSIYKSLAIFFLFEGSYILINYIANEIWSETSIIKDLHDIGFIIFGTYVLISIYKYRHRKIKSESDKQ